MSEQNFEASAPGDPGYMEASAMPAAQRPKQGLTIYTVMLVISFICLIIGTIILFMEYQKFGGWDTNSARPSASASPQVDLDDSFYV